MLLKDWLELRRRDRRRNRKLPNGFYSMPANIISRAIVRALRREEGAPVLGWRLNTGTVCETAVKRPRNFAYDYVTPSIHEEFMQKIKGAILEYRTGPFDATHKLRQLRRINRLILSAKGIALQWY